jgi:hypothetical protein
MHIPKSAEHQMHIFAWVITIFSDFFASCSSLSLSPHSHAFIRTFVKLNVYVPTTIAPLETYSLNLINPDHAWDVIACF